jgi:ribonuclease P protein component
MVFAPERPPSAGVASWSAAEPKGANAYQPSHRMPRVERLKTRAEFLSVAAAKRKWVTPGLILQAKPWSTGDDEDGKSSSRHALDSLGLGFTVSRKVGNAVARNRAKRRLRAAAAEVFSKSAKAGFDYVLIGRKATLDRPYQALVEDLRQALIRLGRPGGRRDAPKPARGERLCGS